MSQDECIRDLFVSSCLYSNVDTPINLVGGCMLGYIGDKYGRKKALELRLLVVCIVSSCARHVSLNSRNLMHAFVAFF